MQCRGGSMLAENPGYEPSRESGGAPTSLRSAGARQPFGQPRETESFGRPRQVLRHDQVSSLRIALPDRLHELLVLLDSPAPHLRRNRLRAQEGHKKGTMEGVHDHLDRAVVRAPREPG